MTVWLTAKRSTLKRSTQAHTTATRPLRELTNGTERTKRQLSGHPAIDPTLVCMRHIHIHAAVWVNYIGRTPQLQRRAGAASNRHTTRTMHACKACTYSHSSTAWSNTVQPSISKSLWPRARQPCRRRRALRRAKLGSTARWPFVEHTYSLGLRRHPGASLITQFGYTYIPSD